MAQEPIKFKSWRDLPLMTASLGNTSVMKTGSWRNVEPHHVDQIAPCTLRCPAGNDVVGFVTYVAEGRLEDAWKLLAETTPFPGTCGRVCPHPCEFECNRSELGSAINIHTIERYIGDIFRDNPPELPKKADSGKKVAVIGSGPAGLSTAYQLALSGHSVTVYEAHSKAGGMLRVGIPDYRLPPEVLDGEIRRIENLGVVIVTDCRVDRNKYDELMEQYDALFAAGGLTKSRPLGVPGDDADGIISGIELLRRINLGEPDGVGNKLLVVGGGNTAMDVARAALRLGKEVSVIYRRTRAEMPAIAEEIDELIEEGIDISFLATPTKIIADPIFAFNAGSPVEGVPSSNDVRKISNKIKAVKCIRMKLGKPDDSGRRRPVPVEGSEFTVEVDTIVTAVGEVTDLSFLPDELKERMSWNIPADELGRTFEPKLYAGGDIADGAGTVTAAIGYGRRAAIAIDRMLKEADLPEDAASSPSLRERTAHVVRFDELNIAYFEEKERSDTEALPVNSRISSFDEVRAGFSEADVIAEAKRCFSCGTCPACDNCYIFCPDAAITPVRNDDKKLYIVDYDYCKGCGLCAAECPRACIVMKNVR